MDNWGVQRPFRSARGEHPKWQTQLEPHWDYSPWLFEQERRVKGIDPGYQGIVALNDHDLATGCHRNLPGCVAHLTRVI